ncbi:hypothetical protein BJY04DRAFT_215090 [Aspergillus karnatakaensis]|uniref:oxidoreductase, 2OG-Fe(II) oxygenase family n=1 Tax=Aspergillus karnatakaensis TaxID=1810916 RepID=UPI003CCCD871
MPSFLPSFSLSTIFYLIPLYFLVIAPALRQLFPADPNTIIHNASYNPDYDDHDTDTGIPANLNLDAIALEDPEPPQCDESNNKYKIHIFSHTPLIMYIEDFLSQTEADYLVNISLPIYTPSPIYTSSTSNKTDKTKRDSQRALLPRTDPIKCIEARARAFQGHKPHLYIERLWTQRYNISGHYTHHYDWASNSKARGAGRLSTFMVYVDDKGLKGGGTNFPYLRKPRGERWCSFIECGGESESQSQGVTFKPIKGNAIFWMNLRADGSGYPETWHASLPVEEGEKVGMNIWSWYQPPRGFV